MDKKMKLLERDKKIKLIEHQDNTYLMEINRENLWKDYTNKLKNEIKNKNIEINNLKIYLDEQEYKLYQLEQKYSILLKSKVNSKVNK